MAGFLSNQQLRCLTQWLPTLGLQTHHRRKFPCIGTALNIPCGRFALEQMAKFHHHLCISLFYFPWTSQAFHFLANGPAPSQKHPMQQKASRGTESSLG